MAFKRRLGGAVHGLAGGLEDIFAMLMQDQILTKRATGLQRQRAQDDALNDFRTGAKELTPEKVQSQGPDAVKAQYDAILQRLPPEMRALVGETPNFEGMDSPVAKRVGPARRRIESATTPAQVPDYGGLSGLLSENRVTPDQEMPNLLPGSGGGPSGAKLPTPELSALLSEAEGKRGLLKRELPREAVNYSDEMGNALTSFLTEEEQGNLGGVRRERTDEQEAARQGTLRSATAQSESDVAHAPGNIVGAARRAGAIRGAEQGASLSQDKAFGAGSFKKSTQVVEDADPTGNKMYRVIDTSPDAIGSQTGTNVPSETTTDGMRQSWDYANRAVASHNILAKLEPILAQRGLLVTYAQMNMAPEAITDPVVRQYAQAAREFINSQARRESGAAISEVEYDRYVKTSGFKPGDDPGTLGQKMDTRRRTIQGLVGQTGRRLGEMFTTMDELKQLPSAAGKSDQQLKQEAEAAGYRVY